MNVILDCDPGHDDAVALMLLGASPKFNLLGITTVSGNQTIEKVTINALNLCQYFNLPVGVFEGAEKPLIKEPSYCPAIHGESGLDGYTFPPLTRKAEPVSATDFIIQSCHQKEKVTLIMTGPLTNFGLAYQKDPSIVNGIEKVVIMGGSMGMGNVTPAAEFNILVDPEAASLLFNSGLEVYMNGLDITRKVLVTEKEIQRVEKLNNSASKIFVPLMRVFNDNQRKIFQFFKGAPLHDPVTVVSLLDPKAITYQKMNVDIDVSKGPSYGRTNCDISGYLHKEENAYVATKISIARYWNVVVKTLSLYR